MLKPMPACSLGAGLLVAGLAGAPLAAHAQVYKCTQANGSVGYQSTPCPAGTRPAAHPTAAQLNAQEAARPKDDKPYDDPYKSGASERPYPAEPSVGAGTATIPGVPQAQPAEQSQASRQVADVQARNRRESQQQAYAEAHKNDMTPARAQACGVARHSLGVLSEQRPVYSYDNKGNRVFIEDTDRAAALARAQQQVAENCR
jgi:hypothetical protein